MIGINLSFIGIVVLFSLGGCFHYANNVSETSPPPSRQAIETSSDVRPLWLDNPGQYVKLHQNEGKRFFVGVADGQPTYADGRLAAMEQAKQRAAEAIQSVVSSLYQSAIKADDRQLYGIYGQTVEHEFVDNLSVTANETIVGLTDLEYYWVKKKTIVPGQGATSTWDVAVLAAMPEKIYKKNVYLAILKQEQTLSQDSIAAPQVDHVRKVWLQQNPELIQELPSNLVSPNFSGGNVGQVQRFYPVRPVYFIPAPSLPVVEQSVSTLQPRRFIQENRRPIRRRQN